MNKKAIAIITTIIILLLSMSGCWDRTEPKDLAIVVSIIYDIDENNMYQVVYEILKPTSQGSGGGMDTSGKAYMLLAEEGDTLPIALMNANRTLENKIYGGNNKIRFVTEKFAESKMDSLMDFILRDNLTDERPLIIVIKNEDKLSIFDAEIGLSQKIGSYSELITKTGLESGGFTVEVNTLDFIKAVLSEGKQPVAGVIEAIPKEAVLPSEEEGGGGEGSSETPKKMKLVFEGLAVFKDTTFLGYINDKDTRAYNILVNDAKNLFFSALIGEDKISATVINPRTDIKTFYDIDGNITVDITVKTTVMLTQNDTQIDLSRIENVKLADDALSKSMEEEIRQAISNVQTEYQSDIFGFGSYFHQQHPKKWKEIKKNWDDEYFANAIINVKVEQQVTLDGETREPFGKEAQQ